MKPKPKPKPKPYVRKLQIQNGEYVIAAKSGDIGISNFILHAVRTERDRTDSLLRFVRFEGDCREVFISAATLSCPAAFREFCLNQGNYTWAGGMVELVALNFDLAHDFAALVNRPVAKT